MAIGSPRKGGGYQTKSAVFGFPYGKATSLDLSITVRSYTGKSISLINRMTNKFQGGAFRIAVTDVNDKAGAFVQQGQVLRLKEKIKETGRTQTGQHTLEIALLDERNRRATVSGFIVGVKTWLDESPAALYYRRIEEGDPNTFSAYVLFTSGFGTSGPYSPNGGNRSKPLGYKHRTMLQGRGVFVTGIGPYPAYHYSEGGREYLAKYDMRQRYIAALANVGIPLNQFQRRRKKR